MQLADTKRWRPEAQTVTDRQRTIGSREPRTTKLFVLVPETNIEIQKKAKKYHKLLPKKIRK